MGNTDDPRGRRPPRDLPEVVTTDRLVLRRPVAGDREALVALLGDARIPETQFPRRFRTAAAIEDALRRAIVHWSSSGFGPWVVLRRADGVLVGRVGLMTSEYDGRRCVEAKWFLGPDHWGFGYATEAAGTGVGMAFTVLDLSQVLAWTMTTNHASQAVMRRLGFQRLAEFDRSGLPHVAYRLTRARWRARRDETART